ncbi:MAG: archease [Caldisphaeraceae archaeon]|nr:archease [Caldisphaeraceae archaeon]MEB3692199.1 archease [Caldisphaeraceae archaeon]MEB3797982.1 archease [Caldisphaeraceae archaeon]
MGRCRGYEFIDHTSDVLIRAYGKTLEEAFEQSALAVYNIITDTNKVEPKVERVISIDGIDLYNLLYRWIESLLYYTDAEGLVFSYFKVNEIKNEIRLSGIVRGERFDPNKHEHRTAVKAMTYSQMDIAFSNGCWKIDFVVDI